MLNALVAVLHPLVGNPFCRPPFACHTPQIVVHTHFVVQVIKTCSQVGIVLIRVVAFADEKDFLVFLAYSRDGPGKKLYRHHLRHIYAETVYAFGCPKEQYIAHLDPCRGNRIELFLTAALIKDTIVEFDGLIPVILARMAGETVITGHFSGKLLVALQVFIH